MSHARRKVRADLNPKRGLHGAYECGGEFNSMWTFPDRDKSEKRLNLNG